MKRTFVVFGAILILCIVAWWGTAEGRVVGTRPLIAKGTSGPHSVAETSLAAGAVANEVELIYDSGPELYSPDDDVLTAEWAVRYTPPQACSLAFIQIATFQNAGPLKLTVYDDNAGAPGNVISGPWQFDATGDMSYQQVEFPVPVDVDTSDFHIGIEILQSVTPHPTFDGDGGTLRTAYRLNASPWALVENLDMVMRAYVRPYGADGTAPVLLHIPSSLSFAGDGAYEIVAKLSDQSGIQSATVHYSSDGVNYQSASLSEGGAFFSGQIPAYPVGTNVRYYLTARDNSPAFNTAVLPASGAATPFSYTVQPGQELRYDDGLPEEFWIESDIFDNNAFGVYCTPSSFPAIISHLRVLVDDTTSFLLTVQAGGTGTPGTVLAGPFLATADPFSGWADVYIPEGERPAITSGGFFIVLWWFPATPDLPAVATDVTAVSNRSIWYDNAFGWNGYSGGNWIMRAGVQTPTGIVEIGGDSRPGDWRLNQNSPNPFNPSTQISFSLQKAATVNLQIHNVLGQLVRELHSGYLESGDYQIEWDGRDRSGSPVSTGVYFYTLRTDSFAETRKMLLLK